MHSYKYRRSTAGLSKDNPLGKVPCMMPGDGMVLYDYAVICDYLDSLAGNQPHLAAGLPR
jgi:glutathione S-transferase